MNSLRSLGRAIEYEIERQIELARGRRADRAGDPALGRGRRASRTAMRSKEGSYDYRYFPEPDLVPVAPTDEMRAAARAAMPELPAAPRGPGFVDEWGISETDARTLARAPGPRRLRRGGGGRARRRHRARTSPTGRTGDVLGVPQRERACRPWCCRSRPTGSPSWSGSSPTARSRAARPRTCSRECLREPKRPKQVVEERGLAQVSDAGELGAVVDEVLAANADAVAEYRAGDDKVRKKKRGFLMGEVMKALQGRGNPQVVNQLLDEKLARITVTPHRFHCRMAAAERTPSDNERPGAKLAETQHGVVSRRRCSTSVSRMRRSLAG